MSEEKSTTGDGPAETPPAEETAADDAPGAGGETIPPAEPEPAQEHVPAAPTAAEPAAPPAGKKVPAPERFWSTGPEGQYHPPKQKPVNLPPPPVIDSLKYYSKQHAKLFGRGKLDQQGRKFPIEAAVRKLKQRGRARFVLERTWYSPLCPKDRGVGEMKSVPLPKCLCPFAACICCGGVRPARDIPLALGADTTGIVPKQRLLGGALLRTRAHLYLNRLLQSAENAARVMDRPPMDDLIQLAPVYCLADSIPHFTCYRDLDFQYRWLRDRLERMRLRRYGLWKDYTIEHECDGNKCNVGTMMEVEPDGTLIVGDFERILEAGETCSIAGDYVSCTCDEEDSEEECCDCTDQTVPVCEGEKCKKAKERSESFGAMSGMSGMSGLLSPGLMSPMSLGIRSPNIKKKKPQMPQLRRATLSPCCPGCVHPSGGAVCSTCGKPAESAGKKPAPEKAAEPESPSEAAIEPEAELPPPVEGTGAVTGASAVTGRVTTITARRDVERARPRTITATARRDIVRTPRKVPTGAESKNATGVTRRVADTLQRSTHGEITKDDSLAFIPAVSPVCVEGKLPSTVYSGCGLSSLRSASYDMVLERNLSSGRPKKDRKNKFDAAGIRMCSKKYLEGTRKIPGDSGAMRVNRLDDTDEGVYEDSERSIYNSRKGNITGQSSKFGSASYAGYSFLMGAGRGEKRGPFLEESKSAHRDVNANERAGQAAAARGRHGAAAGNVNRAPRSREHSFVKQFGSDSSDGWLGRQLRGIRSSALAAKRNICQMRDKIMDAIGGSTMNLGSVSRARLARLLTRQEGNLAYDDAKRKKTRMGGQTYGKERSSHISLLQQNQFEDVEFTLDSETKKSRGAKLPKQMKGPHRSKRKGGTSATARQKTDRRAAHARKTRRTTKFDPAEQNCDPQDSNKSELTKSESRNERPPTATERRQRTPTPRRSVHREPSATKGSSPQDRTASNARGQPERRQRASLLDGKSRRAAAHLDRRSSAVLRHESPQRQAPAAAAKGRRAVPRGDSRTAAVAEAVANGSSSAAYPVWLRRR